MKTQVIDQIKGFLNRGARDFFWLQSLVILVLPIFENLLTSVLTSAPPGQRWIPGTSLALVAGFHLLLGVMILRSESKTCTPTLLASAYDLSESCERLRHELDRRDKAYELVREAFDKLTVQTCSIAGAPREAWCLGGFHTNLLPTLAPFLESIDVALGVKATRFTLEAYFEPGIIPVVGREEVGKNGLCQGFFHSTHLSINRCAGVCMDDSRSPASLGMKAAKAYEQHISENKQLFFESDKPRDGIYFRRFAVCPIRQACDAEQIGVLVLTSMQDDPFADDVLDVLKFISTLVSKYLTEYQRCFFEYHAHH